MTNSNLTKNSQEYSQCDLCKSSKFFLTKRKLK